MICFVVYSDAGTDVLAVAAVVTTADAVAGATQVFRTNPRFAAAAQVMPRNLANTMTVAVYPTNTNPTIAAAAAAATVTAKVYQTAA